MKRLRFACPRCRRPLKGKACSTCKKEFRSIGGHIPDFIDDSWGNAETVLNWSGARLARRRRPATAWEEKLRYHDAELARQASIEPVDERVWRSMTLTRSSTVLDIGCGAGQTLRHLAHLRPADRVGLDRDAEALAYGYRLTRVKKERIRFVRGTAHALPFPDRSFSHVISRDALTFMHQRRAIKEMARVLRPGGYLYLYVEGPAYDLRMIREAGSFKSGIGRLRDLAYGIGHHLTGWQPAPGGRWRGGRAFASVHRLGRMLVDAGCAVVDKQEAWPILGLPSKVEIVARRAPRD